MVQIIFRVTFGTSRTTLSTQNLCHFVLYLNLKEFQVRKFYLLVDFVLVVRRGHASAPLDEIGRSRVVPRGGPPPDRNVRRFLVRVVISQAV
jgi:hypothetical protein